MGKQSEVLSPLTAEREQGLTARIDAAVYAERVLAQDVTSGVCANTAELTTVVAEGWQAWQELIELNLRFVRYLARRHHTRSGRPMDELVQEGCLGLMEAIRRFDSGRGTRLATAAGPWITAAMSRVDDYATLTPGASKRRDRRRVVRKVAEELWQAYHRDPTTAEVAARVREPAATVAQHLTDEPQCVSLNASSGQEWDPPDLRWDPAVAYEEATVQRARQLMACLPSAHRRVVEIRYGFAGDSPTAWKALARSLGVGVARARRLEHEAREMMREAGGRIPA